MQEHFDSNFSFNCIENQAIHLTENIALYEGVLKERKIEGKWYLNFKRALDLC